MRALPSALVICLLAPTVALAQGNPNPLSTFNRTAYGAIENILLHSAEKMPEENYSFKPSEAVGSYGQIVRHLTDAQYLFCSIELGEKNPDLKPASRDSRRCHSRGSNSLDRVLEKAQGESNMKYVRSILSLVALMSLSTVVFVQSDAQKAPSDSQKAYDKLKTLDVHGKVP
jgi:hypothetical protein